MRSIKKFFYLLIILIMFFCCCKSNQDIISNNNKPNIREFNNDVNNESNESNESVDNVYKNSHNIESINAENINAENINKNNTENNCVEPTNMKIKNVRFNIIESTTLESTTLESTTLESIRSKAEKLVENTYIHNINDIRYCSFNENFYNPTFIEEGASSKVYRIKINNNYYTCKKFKYGNYNEIKFIKEINILKNISGIRLPSFYKFFKTTTNCFILYDFIKGEDLFYIIQKYDSLLRKNYNLIAKIIYEITMGLEELFKYNYVHLDLKPENIIISSLNPVKLTIIDLAYCKKLNAVDRKSFCGTYGYASPELLLYKQYYHNSDIWSLGVILYTILTGKPIFSDERDIYKNILRNFRNIYNYELDSIFTIPTEARRLLDKMLQPLPANRLSIKEVFDSEFIKQINK